VAVLRKEYVFGKLHASRYLDTFGQAPCTDHVTGSVSYPEARMMEEVTICDTTSIHFAA
jgi:hypothetical protein